MMTRFAPLLCALMLPIAGYSADASASASAVAQVQVLASALLKSMQAAPAVSMAERYRRLEPVIDQVFALPIMTRLSVGADWARFQPQQQADAIAAFRRYTIANYAHNFRSFSGQRFEVDSDALTHGAEKIVRTQLITPQDTPASLLYRMIAVDGVWKVVDVYYDGISQLTLHRVDFAGAVASGGAPALIAHLNKVSDDLLR
ncbi:MAG TPA: ABC transporter substrate-binding protein [Steroidobacteraceae bacterium]|nr:ABC transporter substrate-binding protein [Steroidobacteraceae bacterium]